MRFRRTRNGIESKLEPNEAALLRQLATDLLGLLDSDVSVTGPPGRTRDPLEDLVGLSDARPGRIPDDPALARLLPDAYPEDTGASAEFRRLTEADLRAAKRSAAQAVVGTLKGVGPRLVLDDAQARAWLGLLNDLRLTLGVRLEIDDDDYAGPADPAMQPVFEVYSWLGAVQETLVRALSKG